MPDHDPTTEIGLEADEVGPATEPQPLVPGVEPGHLVPYAQAAGLAFLSLLALGAVFLIALKLQFPRLGAGADPIDVLTSIVILSLALLRAPIHVGGLTFTVLPLGALALVYLLVRWSCRTAAPAAPARRGLVVGLIFAALAAVAALIFRFRFESQPIFAGAFGSFLFSFLWVALAAAATFAAQREPLARRLGRALTSLAARRAWLFEGIRTGIVMLGLGSVAAAAAGLLWVIVVLLTGGGPDALGAGDLVAALIYIVAFAPNLVLAVLALSLGAPIETGAALTVAGRLRGPLREVSVFSDGVGAAWLLLLIPLVTCAGAGFWARGNVRDPSSAATVLAVAALVFGSTVATLGWLGEARVGARIASERGFGVIAPRPLIVFGAGLLWAAGAGFAGWWLAERRSS
ncbi:MAG: hypothetical protein M3N53_01140 [Actinomycetota bacterium]|nr:hypothetical protein [Actinomycetota bacterium]